MTARQEPTRDPLKAVLMLLLATFCWGFSFPLIKGLLMVQHQLAPHGSEWFLASQLMAVRFGGAAVVMLVICFGALRRITGRELKLGIGLGVFSGLGMLLQVAALSHTLASTSAFLTQFYVLLIPITLALIHRRLPSALVWVSCALVIIGMGALCGMNWPRSDRGWFDFTFGWGEWITLLASVLFTGQILWLDRAEFASTDKRVATLVMFATIAAMFVPMALWTATDRRDLWRVNASWTAAGVIAFLVLVCAVASFNLMNVWQPRVHPTHAGLILRGACVRQRLRVVPARMDWAMERDQLSE